MTHQSCSKRPALCARLLPQSYTHCRSCVAVTDLTMSLHRPPFLRCLEADLDRRLRLIEATPGLNRFSRADCRLEVFREVFGKAAVKLITYGPLLSRVRTEYEAAIEELKKEAAFADREKKKILQEYTELQQSVLDQVTQSTEELTSIKPSALEQLRHRARLAHAQSKLERLEREKSEMALVLTKQERLLVEERAKMNQEQEAKNIMYKEYAELQNEFSQYKNIIKEQEDPVVLRLALDQSKRDLTAAHAQLAAFHHQYDCVVPQVEFDRMELKVAGLEEANNVLTRENNELTEEGKRLRLSNAELLQMVEELVTIVEERRLTQRQDNLDKIVTAGVKKWQRVIAKHKK